MAKRILIGALLLAAIALGVAIYRYNLADQGSPLSGQTLADFSRSTIDGCVARQKVAPGNAGVDEGLIDKFCACYSDALVKRVTSADLDRLKGRSAIEIQAELRPKMQDADQVCEARMDELKP